jgi:hypothetical protein
VLQQVKPLLDFSRTAIVQSGGSLFYDGGAHSKSSIKERTKTRRYHCAPVFCLLFTGGDAGRDRSPAPGRRRRAEISRTRSAIAAAAIGGVRFSRYDAGGLGRGGMN